MYLPILICTVTCLAIIASVLFFPKIRLGRFAVDTYPAVALIGACLMLFLGGAEVPAVLSAITADTAVNPLKILVLFISMTVLSVYLDEVGFFSYVAHTVLHRAGKSQTKLFLTLYVLVSVLTVFTSNDIIILTFTPFICYFCRSAKISPMPYLVAEFVAANTWSMALVIGNPTNIYLTGALGVGFAQYVKVMILPTLAGGVCAFLLLMLLFQKKLKEPILCEECEKIEKPDRIELILGLIHLGGCTVLLAVGGYVGIPMWIVSLAFALSLLICAAVLSAARKKRPRELSGCLRRAPWQLIPFVLSMFVLILGLEECGATGALAGVLSIGDGIFSYGASSFAFCNLINNIPMSVLYSSVLSGADTAIREGAVYATVVGSNLGALFTPIGALAGIMWSSLLKKADVKMNYGTFVKYLAPVSVPTLAAVLAVLSLLV